MTGVIPSGTDLYKAARTLAKEGQPVFPCYSENEMVNGREHRAKAPMTKNGLRDATTDKAQIKRWWTKRPDAAIGIPTGIMWDVLDVDVKHDADGRVHLPRLMRHGLLNGCQRLVKTPSGGWHLYFRSNPAIRNRSSANLGLDVRGDGGYVLAPPSFIDDDENSIGVYERMDDPVGSTDEPLLWDLITATLKPVNTTTGADIPLLPIERKVSLGRLKDWLMARQAGERNNALHWAVRRCLDNGLDPFELEEVALHIGLEEAEVKATIVGAIRRTGVDPSELLTEGEALFGTD